MTLDFWDFSAPQTSRSGISALAVFATPREGRQQAEESCSTLDFWDFSAPQTSRSGISALAVFATPREGRQ